MNMFQLLKLRIKGRYEPRTQGIVTFFNPYSYYLARREQKIFSQMDEFYIDGQLLVRILTALGIPGIKRFSFDNTSLAPIVFKDCIKGKKSIYFIGAKEEEISTSVKIIAENYPGLEILGYRNGYFNSKLERGEVLENIKKISPDVVVSGMGTPYQEEFLVDLRSHGWSGVGYTCGGFFHQSTTGLNYYPKWMDKLNIRWVYRIYDEPKLVKRYFIQYPIAISYILFDFVKYKLTS
ncbi:WecB/TagA/CpsF family glycosyltransferase [Motilimonas cestriensis]|uniref:WecB/TagA/CpsF family glycosyltransferase n=1 Tax=Motilimonas cestriensis TaxID=2742685 RepID=A0ABS8WBF3_9GAMM|nr:WecB/TagA/CpsF family glycosyltransferase [Motilimonas cestriensis]MCE2594725.1 WecB/TagA/CpsF family glycosyltransferase [Motilimonas cestriensis]